VTVKANPAAAGDPDPAGDPGLVGDPGPADDDAEQPDTSTVTHRETAEMTDAFAGLRWGRRIA
jgi:hypothetical protein